MRAASHRLRWGGPRPIALGVGPGEMGLFVNERRGACATSAAKYAVSMCMWIESIVVRFGVVVFQRFNKRNSCACTVKDWLQKARVSVAAWKCDVSGGSKDLLKQLKAKGGRLLGRHLC